MAKYYISASVDGKKPYIVAVIKGAGISFNRLGLILGVGSIAKAVSKRGDYKHSDGIKLTWDGLLDNKGRDIVSPRVLVRRFNILKAKGFEIIDTDFRAAHFGKTRAVTRY